MDLSIKMNEGRFNFRTAVVLMDKGRVLLHKNEYDEHWALPGGRVALFEETAETAVREMKEELNAIVTVDRLLWFTENFFEFEGEPFHEIATYYKADLVSELYKGDEIFYGIEGDRVLLYQWFPLNQLQEIKLYPIFLIEGLKSLPNHTEMISIKELD